MIFEEKYEALKGDTSALDRWLIESKYADKNYGIGMGSFFKILTGAFDEDNSIENIPLPFTYKGFTIVDMRNRVRGDITPHDKIIDFINKRGTGNHIMETAITLKSFEGGTLSYMEKPLIEILTVVVATRIAGSLSLDNMDKDIFTSLFKLYLTGLVYGVNVDIKSIYLTNEKSPGIEEDEIDSFIAEKVNTIEGFLKFLSSLDVSNRLANLNEELFLNSILSISFGPMGLQITMSMVKPQYFLPLIYTTMKNPFHKKSFLHMVLVNNKKYLDVDTLLGNQDKFYKTYLR